MNISTILQGFSSYLDGLNENSQKNYNTNSSTINIFMYSNEFKSYIVDELDIADSSIFSKSINDILSMDVENGKLVESDENSDSFVSSKDDEQDIDSMTENQEENVDIQETDNVLAEDNTLNETIVSDGENAGNTENTNGQTQAQEMESNVLTDILNNIFQDETVIASLDTDKSGDLNKDEISSFLNAINESDGDIDNLSIEDIFEGINQIKEDSESIKEDSEPEVESETNVQEQNSTTTPSVSSGNSNGGFYNNSGIVPSSQSAEIQEKTLDNMTREELNAELTTAESDLAEQQEVLSSLLDGSDTKLQEMNDNIDLLYDAYLDELESVDEEMAEEVNNLKEDIDAKQKDIDSKDQEIANQESVVADSKTAYENSVSNREQLEASLSTLESTSTANMEESQVAELNEKIAELTTKVSEAEKAEEKAKESWDKAQEKLDSLNKEKDTLQKEFDKLNKQMTELEKEIVEKYPEIQESLQAYNDAKKERDTYKSEAVNAAKSEVQTAQEYVNDINTAINNLDNKEIAKEYSLDPLNMYDSEEGSRLVDVARQMLDTYGSTTGLCATGVSRTFEMAYGLSLGGNGCDWDTNMDGLVDQGMFVEVTSDFPSADDLSNLPAGAVVCWEATTGYGGGGEEFGHVTIADGNGGEISDHYAQNIYKTIGGRSDNYRVYIPV